MYEHIQGLEGLIDETRELIQEIACSKIKRQFMGRGGKITTSYVIDASHKDCQKLIRNLKILYEENGMGFKLISSYLGNISYTRLRTVFETLGIEKRAGQSCVTEGLKKIRSERAKTNNPWTNWTEKYKDKDIVNKHHVAGWYLNESKSKYVWLRSSWEYGYAKFLNDNRIEWDVEARSYLLSDGRYYRPDFFIYENNNLSKIVEIKSRWSNGSLERIDKFEMFKKEYGDISAELISDELFLLINRKQKDIINEWKKVRLMELKND
jgi:hypothetical protein